jgi:hypothetical protein
MMENIPSIKVKTSASFVRKKLIASGILALTGEYRRHANPQIVGAGTKLLAALAAGDEQLAPEYSAGNVNNYMQQDIRYLARRGHSLDEIVDLIEAKMGRAASGKKRSRRAIEGSVTNWFKKIGRLS